MIWKESFLKTQSLQVPAEQKELAKAAASQQIMAIKQDYQNEASISASLVEASQGQTSPTVLTQDAQQRLLKLLQQLPHGAIKYSEAVSGNGSPGANGDLFHRKSISCVVFLAFSRVVHAALHDRL